MTHSALHQPAFFTGPLHWHDCVVEQYANNNGIVLKWGPQKEVLFFIDGSDLSQPERASPIFKMLLQTHNRALEEGFTRGKARKAQEIRGALDLA